MGRDRRLQTRATRLFNNTSSESKQLRTLRRSPAPFSSVPVHLGSPTAARKTKSETWKVRPQTSPSRSAGHPLIGHPGLSRTCLSSALGCRSAFLFVWRCGRQRYLDPSRMPGARTTKVQGPIGQSRRDSGKEATRRRDAGCVWERQAHV